MRKNNYLLTEEKMKKGISLTIFLFAFLFNACSTVKETTKTPANDLFTLKQKIHERFDDSMFAHAHWGVLIKSLKTGEIWYERNSQKMFMPASNEKVITGAAALETLGPDFTFETYLNYEGTIKDSILEGNLVVYGNGDPTLYTRLDKDPLSLFKSWAAKLSSMGIKQINGNIIGDDNAFEDYPYGYGWTYDDFDAYYSAEINSLQLNENSIDLKINPPSTKDGKITVEPNLPSSYYQIVDNTTVGDTGHTRISVNRAFGKNAITINGYVKAGTKPFEETPSLYNPTLFYATALREELERDGIKVTGEPKDCDDIQNWKTTVHNLTLIDKHDSPLFKDILAGLMKPSQNLYAETFVRVLGWKKTGIGSFKEGKKVVEDVLKGFGVKPGTYAYMDGSGLSRYNYTSPEILVMVLEGMRKSNDWDVWYKDLPIAGVDGTLKNRMKGTPAENNVHAKTGTISNVRGLSGYVTTADGEEVVFSFLVNGHLRSSADTEYITDSVLEMISNLDRK
jgi:D-alanyl-D-alanine carboxypeptidase/D-alanyl-D-alanine-endopeptidase (penicillin-binding protein 4)